MVDADDPAIGRVDQQTDPQALTEDELRQQLRENPNLSGEAPQAFAEEIANKRQPVRDKARDLLSKRLQANPANPEVIQLRTKDGRMGPSVPDRGQVDLDLDGTTGEVRATVNGETVDLGRVDLDAGSDGQRRVTRYSREQHPEQQRRP